MEVEVFSNTFLPNCITSLPITGPANFNPQGCHTRRQEPEGRTCVHTHRKEVGGTELARTPLFTNPTFVLLPFIKAATLCSVDLLHYVC
jgi:hypothetical protein